MFDNLTARLSRSIETLRGRGRITDENITETLREVRVALLEADVALPVVKTFIDGVRAKAVGQAVLRSVSPAQMVVKIVHDHLVESLGSDQSGALNLNAVPPVVLMMVGLQG